MGGGIFGEAVKGRMFLNLHPRVVGLSKRDTRTRTHAHAADRQRALPPHRPPPRGAGVLQGGRGLIRSL